MEHFSKGRTAATGNADVISLPLDSQRQLEAMVALPVMYFRRRCIKENTCSGLHRHSQWPTTSRKCGTAGPPTTRKIGGGKNTIIVMS
jgi:hypothetical protein